MKKFKIFTLIDRVNFFSELFVEYYSNFFEKKDFYFLIHDFNFDEISNFLKSKNFDKSQFQKYDCKSFGKGGMTEIINKLQQFFIKEGFITIFVNVDEFIFQPDLKNYIINTNNDFIAPTGIVLFQNENESKLNIKKNIFDQRTKCFLDNQWYSKVCIVKKSYKWMPGNHNKEWYIKTDENVFLLDIGIACKNIMMENNTITKKIYNNVESRYTTSEIENLYKQNMCNKNFIDIPEILLKNKSLFQVNYD